MLVHCPYCPQAFDPGPNSDPSRLTCPACGRAFDLAARETRSSPPDGAAPIDLDDDAPPPLLEPGAQLGAYRIVEPIGRGGMGVVYKAVQLSLDRTVALKVLPPSLARQSRFLERFDREARALAELSHPHIVSIFDRGVAGELSYIVMEFVDGVSLRQVQQAGGLTPAEALALVPKICAALEYAHARGVIHRDIKPENILLDRQGGVKVADFGLSRILGDAPDRGRITGTNVVMGTFDYMAPEQRERSRDVDHRADLYALGVVLYELLTGELPIGLFEAPSRRRAGLDPRLDAVVLRVLDKDPDRRPQRASELGQAITAILAGGPVGPATAPPPVSRGAGVPRAEPAGATTSMRLELSGWMIALIVIGLIAMLAPLCACGGWWLLVPGRRTGGATAAPTPTPVGPPAPVPTAPPSTEGGND